MSDIAQLESTGVEAQICVTLELAFFYHHVLIPFQFKSFLFPMIILK